MKKTYCSHTDACMDGVYCKENHGGSYGVCEYFPDKQKLCPYYNADKIEEPEEFEDLSDEDVIERWRPGSYAYCVFGGMVYRATIKAIGFVRTEKSTTYHVSYLVPVGTTYVRINWLVGEKRNRLFDTRRQAFMSLGEECDEYE